MPRGSLQEPKVAGENQKLRDIGTELPAIAQPRVGAGKKAAQISGET